MIFKTGDRVAVVGGNDFLNQSGEVRWCERGLVYVRLHRTRISPHGMAMNGDAFIHDFPPEHLAILASPKYPGFVGR